MAYMSQQMKKELAPAIKDVLKQFGMKGSISVNNHSTLCVNIKSGDIDFDLRDGYGQVNTYWIDSHWSGKAKYFLNHLLAAMQGAYSSGPTKWYDNSDAMSDYFDTAYYIDINIGKWNQPYEYTGS